MLNNRRSGLRIMASLIGLIKPLAMPMVGAISAGVMGFLLSFGLGTFGAFALVRLISDGEGLAGIPFGFLSFQGSVLLLIICAATRGVFQYLEQYANHFIAFTILAQLRNKVFKAMRRLAPAKLEQKNQGDLVSMVKGDIELLEVFYAHTVSPVTIAAICWLLLGLFYWQIHPLLMVWALACYAVIGVLVPLIASAKARETGMRVRNEVGALNGFFLDLLRGIRELIQYGREKQAAEDMGANTESLVGKQEEIRKQESKLVAWTDTICVITTAGMAVLAGVLASRGVISGEAAFIAVVLQSSTYAPFISLATLGNILTHTFASGERILRLLEEKPQVEVVKDGKTVPFGAVDVEDVHFNYAPNTRSKGDNGAPEVLKGASLTIQPGECLGIMGASGCGKSTLIKLIMRFWDPQKGHISLNDTGLPKINTDDLWSKMSYMTQTPVFFNGTLRDNLLVGKENATDEEIWAALEQASIADMIHDLPAGLDTPVGELGENYSGGERQRIALARCFLAESPMLLLDEPTSNLDSQNEAMVLRSLYQNRAGKTIIMVSHRKSSLGICSRVIHMQGGKCSVKT